MTTAAPDVRLEEVVKRFDETVAVDGISVDIPRGSFFAMLGPSGCGKTTTLRMIGGFEEPTEGRIFLGDQDVVGQPPYKRDVNTVFQSYALFPHMTVSDNVAFGLEQKGVPKDQLKGRVAEMLELVGLSGFARRKPKQLSGGQQQRVALGRALVNHPRVLLLDEPLGALDLKLRKNMQMELKRIQSEVGITFVHVTHDQEEAMTMADRIAVMNQGRIDQIGPPMELYEQPKTAFVAGFLGVSNMVSATVENGGQVRLGDGTSASVPAELLKDAPSNVRIGVRPEKVRLLPASDPAEAGANRLVGTVRDVSYIGVSTQYIIDTPGGDELVAIVQNAGRGARHLDRGESVQLLWDPENTFVITDEGQVPTVEELI
jgi:spermidine/putrescine transport system ATP-binding protein